MRYPEASVRGEARMNESGGEVAKTGPLEILGVGESEERVYRWLLGHSGATVSEAARALALTPGKTRRLLDAIEFKGLATNSPECPRRYLPATPDIALGALMSQHHEGLRQAEVEIQKLQEHAARGSKQNEREQIVELITSREAERQIYGQIHRSAQHEILCLVRSPLLISRLDASGDRERRAQRQSQSRGVHYRSIVDADFLTLPGAVERTREDMIAGEEVKAISSLPFKMVLADRRIALVPLSLELSAGPVLLVRPSALLDAFYVLFEVFWHRAVSISLTQDRVLTADNPDIQLPKGSENLISLLMSGMNDKKIADKLGISLSTLTRQISEIKGAFGARTRFQLGSMITHSLTNYDDE